MSGNLIEVRNLQKLFPIFAGIVQRKVGAVHAVDDISFRVGSGEVVGLVGESGCGKTTSAMCMLRLVEPTAGEVYFNGREIFKMSGRELRKARRDMQMVFQDPRTSLNPRMRAGDIIGEPLAIHKIASGKEKNTMVEGLLSSVGLERNDALKYPHEFSGGQKQRVAIARSLSSRPKFVVLDEPVTALDVSIRADILNLLMDLKKQFDLTYLYISHDLSTVRYITDTVCVMYLGKIVEKAPVDEMFESPLHPYTQALMSAVPIPDPAVKRKKIILTGDVPSPINPPKGCRFHTRCPYKKPQCEKEEPKLVETMKEHFVACFPSEAS